MRSWLKRHGLYNRDPSTHTFFTGGKASISHANQDQFLRHYAMCLHNGVELTLVERTPVMFPFFLDVDLVNRFELMTSTSFLLALTSAFSRVLDCREGSEIIVCCKPSACGKAGVHIIWQDVHVDRETALAVRDEALHHIEFPGFTRNDFDKFVDASVYRSGLRMIWSTKGNHDQHDWYHPYFICKYGSSCMLEKTHGLMRPTDVNTMVHWLKRCSIRSHDGCQTVIRQQASILRSPKSTPISKPIGTSATQKIIDWAERQIPEIYGVGSLNMMHGNEDAHMYVFNTKSKYCANIGREHKNNHVYFVLCERGLFQKCFCTCDTTAGRKHGLCKTFSVCLTTDVPEWFEQKKKPQRSATIQQVIQKQREALFSKPAKRPTGNGQA